MNQDLIYGFIIGGALATEFTTLIIIFALLSTEDMKEKRNQLFLHLCISMFFTLLSDIFLEQLKGNGKYISDIKLILVINIFFVCATVSLFTFYVISVLAEKVYISASASYTILFILGTAFVLWVADTVYSLSWFVVFGSNGTVTLTDFGWMFIGLIFLILLFDITLAFSCLKSLSFAEIFTWGAYILFPLGGLALSIIFGFGVIYSGFALSLLFVYSFEHFQREKKLASVAAELTKSRMKLMVSQIQPHFMYNSLNSIYYLIEQDPEAAREAVSNFSDYLRQNVKALKTDNLVRFSEELSHTDIYLSLEKLRFGNRLTIEKNIKSTDFFLPPLSLQPLVENAVKHGITPKEGGGKLIIESFEDKGYYIIKVIDDGMGFKKNDDRIEFKDMVQRRSVDDHTHVGLSNVTERLRLMCSGNLDIQSSPGAGTTATILIPKEVRHGK